MESKYNTIKLPIEIIYEVDRYMNSHKHEGFTTRVEVIKTALREFFKNGSKNYQPLSGEERGERKHEQMAERTSTQSDSSGLDNAQGESHRANEKRVEDPKGEVESRDGEDASTS